jgi:aspartyl protease family protein
MNKQFALIFAAIVIAASLSVARPPSATATAAPAAAANASDSSETAERPTDTVTLTREPDGHFYTIANVNGTPIRFMIDTGASTVALTRADAQQAGMFFSENDFNEIGRGAGGEIALRPVTLDRVAVGNIEAHDVRGVVIGGQGDISLLGQSFLATLGGVSIEGDTMVLRPV